MSPNLPTAKFQPHPYRPRCWCSWWGFFNGQYNHHHHFAQKMPPEDIIHSGDIFISKKGVLLSPPEFWNTGHPGLRVFQEAPWALPQWQEPPMFLSKSSLSCHWHPRTPLLTPFSRKSLDVYSPLPLIWESPSAKEKVVINHHPSQGLGKLNT